MARFMACDPTKAGPTTRQGFRQKMAAHAFQLRRINGETQESTADEQGNPGRRQSDERAEHRKAGAASHCKTSSGCRHR